MWKAVLGEVGDLAGWHVKDRYESSVVEEVCATVVGALRVNLPNILNDLVGIESQVNEVMCLLSIKDKNVLFIGIYGMGGIGKTTLAKVIHDRVFSQFEANCFVENISQQAKNLGIIKLQEQFILQILKESKKLGNTHEGKKEIAKILRHKKAIIVLDNVETDEPLKALISSHDWFKEGSRVLITSRDNHLLKRFVDKTYEVQPLNECDALKLFSLKAFKEDYPKENYVKLSKDIVDYAGGLPLALEVFGSFLFGRTNEVWESARDYLKAHPDAEILDQLKISFDGLNDLQKELFLDIAFFFNGRLYGCQTIDILKSFGYYPNINIGVLKDKYLIKISEYGRVWMHDLLVKMGHQIVYHESPNEPCKRSRLCCGEDIIHVLENNTVTNVVKGIAVNFSLPEWEHLNLNAFSTMKSLRILEVSHDGEDFHSLKCDGRISKFTLSKNLRVLKWDGYPLESLLFDSHPHNLVELVICQSHIKLLWNANNRFEMLTLIDVSKSKYLSEIPDLTAVPNLRELLARYCPCLSKVHSSVVFLKRLRRLVLQGCERLNELPYKISLPSLKYRDVSDCPKMNVFPNVVDEIPESVNGMEHLEEFDISGTAIRQLPSFILCSKNLRMLSVGGSSSNPISFKLPNSMSSLSSLKSLNLLYCNLIDGALPRDFGSLYLLRSLCIVGNRFTGIPPSVLFLNLRHLYLTDANNLEVLIIPPPRHLRGLTTDENLNYIPSITTVDMRGSKFTRISNNIAHIRIGNLILEDCSRLQRLPKLPFQLKILNLKNCLSLEMLGYDEMDAWISSEMLDIGVLSFVGTYFSNGSEPYKILYLSPQCPIWTETQDISIPSRVSWGPTLESRIPRWFKQKSSSFSGMIQSRLSVDCVEYNNKFWGCALFIVYEAHEDGNSSFRTVNGNNPVFPRFVCRLQVNECHSRFHLHFRVPEVPHVGLNGVWVFLDSSLFWEVQRDPWSFLGVSIETNNKNVELKKCGARLVFKHDAYRFFEALNSISLHGFNGMVVDEFESSLTIHGPIKGSINAEVVQLENDQFPSGLNYREDSECRNGVSSISEYIKVMLHSSFEFFTLFLRQIWIQKVLRISVLILILSLLLALLR